MRHTTTEKLKNCIRPFYFKYILKKKPIYECPICGYQGGFKDKRISQKPNLVRINSKCPGCSSSERHRMMHLILQELFGQQDRAGKSILHIAPEDCLKGQISSYFETYHTADLLKSDVNFNEDIQSMSFADCSYDAVLVSRVLTIPPNLDASLNEISRILCKGGIALIAEIYKHERTREFGKMINGRSREIGIGLISKLKEHFDKVDCRTSNRYDARFQLNNMIIMNHHAHDDFPDLVRIPGIGFSELVAVCHA